MKFQKQQNNKPLRWYDQEVEDNDEILASPEQKIAQKDHHLINTMLKLHDSLYTQNEEKKRRNLTLQGLKITINPSPVTQRKFFPPKLQLLANLWSKELFWILPDSP
jgi:hypothetical protein